MTEEEAKTKWCPAAKSFDASQGPSTPACSPMCIGSACMAWRTSSDPTAGWHSEERQIYVERYGPPKAGGYCGLAGAPQ